MEGFRVGGVSSMAAGSARLKHNHSTLDACSIQIARDPGWILFSTVSLCEGPPDLMMRGSRLWVTAMPVPAQAPHCMLTAAQPAENTIQLCREVIHNCGAVSQCLIELESKSAQIRQVAHPT